MPSCCPPDGCFDDTFDARVADRELRDYRRRGPRRATRLLVEELAAGGVDGQTILDIGAGMGAVHHGLLEAGAAAAVDVDASRAYLDAARAEAVRRGYVGRVRLEHGDFVTLAPSIEPADVVALDRVVCCYPDMVTLVATSAARARRRYGLVLPRDTWWIRLGLRAINAVQWLTRSDFRVYGHPHAAVDAVVAAAGLSRRSRRTAGLWDVLVYARPGG